MTDPIRILIVEDTPTDADLAMREIRKSVPSSEFQRVETESTFLDALNEFEPDLILSDYQLPRFTGMEALRLAMAHAPLTPLIIYTGSINEDIAVECMKAGASNYIIKENIKRLGTAISHALEEKKVRLERKIGMDALKDSEARFSTIFHASPMAIAISRLSDGRLIDVNEAWQELTGFTGNETIIRNSSDLNSWVDSAENANLMRMVKKQGIVRGFEAKLKKKNGETAQLLLSAELAEISGEPCMITMALDITERKQAEEKLKESEARFATVFRVSPISMAITRVHDNCFIDVNEAWQNLTQYKKEEVIGHTPMELDNWADPTEREQLVKQLTEQRIVQNFELKMRRKSGEVLQLLMSADLIELAGEPCMLSIAMDITERKNSERELQQAEERFHKAFRTGPVGLAITRAADGVYIDANNAFSKITGFSHNELINHTSVGLGITTAEQKEEYQRLMKEQNFIRDKEMELQHKLGETRTVLGSMEIIDLNHEICVLSTAIDITGRKRAEKALQESEEKYRALFQNAQVGMFRTKLDGSEILAVNPKFCEIFGYSEQELISKPSTMLWADPEIRFQKTKEMEKEKHLHNFEMEAQTKSGDTIVCLMWAQYLPEKNYVEGSLMDITSRKRAEDWISRLNRQQELILNSAGEGIYGMDNEGRITFINPAMARMIGWDIADLLSHSMHEICHHTKPNGQPYPAEECPIHIALHEGKARHSVSDYYWRRDGTMFPVEYTSTPIRENGKLVGTVVVVSDVTRRLQAENETRQHMTEMEMLYESGLALSQLMSPKEIGQKIIELLEQKMNWHHTAIRLYHPEEGDMLELLAFSQPDITNYEEKLEVEKLFQNRVARLGQGLSGWAIQHSKIVRSGNISNDPRYVETYPGLNSGLYVPIKLGSDMLGVIAIESEIPDAFSEADERLVTTLANQAAVAFGNANLYQTAQQEIIERKRVEELLAEERNQLARRVEERTADLSNANADLARALRVKDEFLASMSHELRTPLTGILGFSEALQLKAYGELSDKQTKTIKSIEDSGRHLLELINDILDLSKIEAGKLELQFTTCSITDICQSSLQLIKGMANQKRQIVYYEPTEEPVAVYVDSRRIKQILVNLLSNAVKFTPEDGELGLDVEPDSIEKKITLTVWDKGIGIKPEDMEKLFKPFTQIDSSLAREYSGTGLGLSLANRLTELHNGKITVESTPGQGSRFTVTLPWTPQATKQNKSESAETNQAHTKGSDSNTPLQTLVVIADDNEVVLDMLSDFLETIKYNVKKVHNGTELLKSVEENIPNIMLVDIQMPGMDGLETIRRIRAHVNPLVASTPIIAVTALAMSGDRERCLKAGANEYLSKPIRLQELATIIQKQMEKTK